MNFKAILYWDILNELKCLNFAEVKKMAVGKNKGLKIGGKKGVKKKIIDPFTRKDWYDIKAPSIFTNRQVGKTLVNR